MTSESPQNVEVISWDGDMGKLSEASWFTAIDEPVRKALTGGFTSTLKAQKDAWEKEGGFLKDILGIQGDGSGSDAELRAELEALREEKKKWDEISASQSAASRDAFEKEISESYDDILSHGSEEPTELFATLVEKGVDIPIAAKVVRETYSIGAPAPAPAPPVVEQQRQLPRAAGIASRGDTVQGSSPRRPLGARPSLDDLLEASADSALSSTASRLGR